jgi:hypothetical protein
MAWLSTQLAFLDAGQVKRQNFNAKGRKGKPTRKIGKAGDPGSPAACQGLLRVSLRLCAFALAWPFVVEQHSTLDRCLA